MRLWVLIAFLPGLALAQPSLDGPVAGAFNAKAPASGASGWAPTSASGLTYWFSSTNIAQANDTVVTNWPDQSGTGLAATNTASSAHLELSQINGRPAVFCFNGNSYLEFPAITTPGCTVFALVNWTAGTDFDFCYGASSFGTFRVYLKSDNHLSIDKYASVAVASSTSTISSGVHVLVATMDTSGNYALYIDSATADKTGTNPQTYSTSNVRFGSASGSDYIAEIGAYSRVLSSGEISSLVGFLKGVGGL